MSVADLEEVWQAIEAEQPSAPGWHARNISRGSIHDLQAGLRVPGSSVGLLYEIPASDVPAGMEWPDAKGFRTDIEVLTPGPHGKIRVVLQLVGAQYRDVFSALASDISLVVLAEPTRGSGFRAFLRRLQAWQKFMQVHSVTGLSAEQVRGLVGELAVIEKLLIPTLGEQGAVEAWQGRHALHDFVFEGRSLEVKSAALTSDPVMTISRINQLDETAVSSLHLCFVPLIEDAANGHSLPDYVARLRGKLKNYIGARHRLDELLVAAGYHDSQAALYSERCLKVGELQIFEVRDEFPRFRQDQLPQGIVAGRYSVSVSACGDFAVDPQLFQETFTGSPDVDD